ncbi:MAG: class I SAM-dependent methyltransferase [Pseudomonadota bacterium]
MTSEPNQPSWGVSQNADAEEMTLEPASVTPPPVGFAQDQGGGAITVADEQEIARLFSLRTLLSRPIYVNQSAWIEHIPFAFWLMEAQRPRVFVELGTHYGVSYFAFCQAAERVDIDVRCFAVDTWEGDEHAGKYDAAVHKTVRDHNEKHYSSFSRLVRSTFEEARPYFADGSIDLLHIDGLHTYDAVKADFESWRPKLSDRAVVIFHDSNVRERQFGVARLIAELRAEYPVFEFTHGNGLAVVGVGSRLSPAFTRLFQADGEPAEHFAISNIFGRLGRACSDAYQANINRDRTRTALKENSALKKAIDQLSTDLMRATVGKGVSAPSGQKVSSLSSPADMRLQANLSAVQAAHQDLERKLADVLKERSAARSAKTGADEKLLKEREASNAKIAELNSKLKTAREQSSKFEGQVEAQKKRFAEAESTSKEVAARYAELRQKHSEVSGKLQFERESVQKLTEKLEKARSQAETLQSSLESVERSERAAADEIAALKDRLTTTEAALSEAQEADPALVLELRSELQARYGEIAALITLAQERDAANAEHIDALKQRVSENAATAAEITPLKAQLAHAEDEVESLRRSLKAAKKHSKDAKASDDAHSAEAAAQASRAAQEAEALRQEIEHLKAALTDADQSRTFWEGRFHELAGSTSWKITKPLRGVVRAVRPRR